MENIIDNPAKFHKLLLDSGLPVVGVSTSGRIDYSRNLTKTEKNKVQDLLNTYDPAPSIDDLRLKEYKKQGIDFDKLLLALWNKIMHNDTTQADEIKSLMQKIDDTIQ